VLAWQPVGGFVVQLQQLTLEDPAALVDLLALSFGHVERYRDRRSVDGVVDRVLPAGRDVEVAIGAGHLRKLVEQRRAGRHDGEQ
jgi:hypothetical protein